MTLVRSEKRGDFGVPQLRNNRVVGFEKKRNVKDLINGGIYFFRREIISFIGDGFQDLDRDLFSELIKRRELGYFIHKGSWRNVGY